MDFPPHNCSVLNSMNKVHRAAPMPTLLPTACQESPSPNSRCSWRTYTSFYWSVTFSSLHSPLGELGPTQEGAAELLHVAHVSIVEVVPCLGRDTQNWDTTLQSHQEHRWDRSPVLQSSLNANQSLGLLQSPGAKSQLPTGTEHSPSGPAHQDQ